MQNLPKQSARDREDRVKRMTHQFNNISKSMEGFREACRRLGKVLAAVDVVPKEKQMPNIKGARPHYWLSEGELKPDEFVTVRERLAKAYGKEV